MRNGNKSILKCVGYVRVSTEEQAQEGISLDAQKRAITDYCNARSGSSGQTWQLLGYYEDDGKSAYSGETRPQFEKMMTEHEQWDCCIAVYLNRFWRNTKLALKWFDEMQEKGKDVVAMDLNLDTTNAMGKFALTVMLGVAQLESDQTSERVKAIFDHKFETDDNTWFTRAPLGYDLKDGKLIVNDAEARIVRTAFNLALRLPQRLVAVELNGMGFTGKSGKPFSQPSIAHILHNPVYCGYVYRKGVLRKNGHKGIVEKELYNDVQKTMWQRGTKARKYPPLELGADKIECKRICTSGRGHAVYVVGE